MRQYIKLLESERELTPEEKKFIETTTNTEVTYQYSIDPETDLINIHTDVMINTRVPEIPVKTNLVSGNFIASIPNNLATLHNAPNVVMKNFICNEGKRLKSLEGGPREVVGIYNVSNNQIKDLVGAPNVVGTVMDISCNDNLISLKGIPKEVGWFIDVRSCPNLSPWEMRYALFTNVINPRGRPPVSTGREEVDKVFKNFNLLSQDGREAQLLEYLERLKELS